MRNPLPLWFKLLDFHLETATYWDVDCPVGQRKMLKR